MNGRLADDSFQKLKKLRLVENFGMKMKANLIGALTHLIQSQPRRACDSGERNRTGAASFLTFSHVLFNKLVTTDCSVQKRAGRTVQIASIYIFG